MAAVRANKSYLAKPGEVAKRWLIIDADGLVLGRLAVAVATRLQGKHKPQYTPHVDCGDFIIVINAGKVKVSGGKDLKKVYYRYTGYTAGLRTQTLEKIRARHPERLIELAVRRMLPKSKLGAHMFKKLKVYAGVDHPHKAQSPEPLKLA